MLLEHPGLSPSQNGRIDYVKDIYWKAMNIAVKYFFKKFFLWNSALFRNASPGSISLHFWINKGSAMVKYIYIYFQHWLHFYFCKSLIVSEVIAAIWPLLFVGIRYVCTQFRNDEILLKFIITLQELKKKNLSLFLSY